MASARAPQAHGGGLPQSQSACGVQASPAAPGSSHPLDRLAPAQQDHVIIPQHIVPNWAQFSL